MGTSSRFQVMHELNYYKGGLTYKVEDTENSTPDYTVNVITDIDENLAIVLANLYNKIDALEERIKSLENPPSEGCC